MKAKTILKTILVVFLGCASVLAGIQMYRIDYKYRLANTEAKKPNVEDTEIFKKIEEVLPTVATKDVAGKGDLSAKYNTASLTAKKTTGWLFIPETNVDYPIMHGDNTYYLNRTWDDKASASGAIFLDQNCNGFAPVSMIHGHNMANGSMFATIQVFYNNGTLKDEDIIYVFDGTTERKYKIFSAFRTSPDIQIKLSLTAGTDIKKYAQQLKDKSHSISSYEVTESPILVLNTCCSDGTGEHFLVVGQEIQ